ncbi:MAG: glycosyl hydrolase family 28-related protein, partial [Sphingomonadaceae bacterium]
MTPPSPAPVLPRRAALAALAGAGAALALPRRPFAQPAAPAPFVDPRAFGARLDGVADDTAALQRAIDEAGRTGRTLFLPAGRALVSDPDRDGACLRLTRAITMTGEGALRSCLVPARGLPPSAAALAIAPDPAFVADQLK